MSTHEATSRLSGEPMRCPTCGTRLVEVERASVLIDACPSCRGVWLDRGELDKILVRERQTSSGAADDEFLREVEGHGRGGSGGDYRKRKKKKRGGFLEDLLDFG